MRLAMDTATRHVVVALGASGHPLASLVREVVPGRGTPLLSLLDEVLAAAGATMADVRAVGVGTGPGSFTGLRAGLATGKTLCWSRRVPLVDLPSDRTIRRAASIADRTLAERVAVVLPAGARDHYVAAPGGDPVLVPPTADLAATLGDFPVAVLDLTAGGVVEHLATRAERLGQPDPVALGAAALGHAAEALLSIMDERLGAGSTADPATLVPRYVALPRGIASVPPETATTVLDTTHGDEAWSRTPP